MYFILDNDKRKQNAIEYISSLKADEKYGVEVKLHKKNRSLAQNRTMWLWLDLIADYMGESANDLHDLFKVRFLGYEDVTIAGEEVRRIKSTTGLKPSEFSKYMSQIELVARELNIILPYPDDFKESMK